MAALGCYVLLAIPVSDPPPPPPPHGTAFSWNQNERWQALEERFRRARTLGCAGVGVDIDARLRLGYRLIDVLEAEPIAPTAAVLDTVEHNVFELAPLIGACVSRLRDYVRLVTDTRTALKRESEAWDLSRRVATDRMYRLLWGGRAALEEVMLQAPPDLFPALVRATDEASRTPSARVLGVTIHSGDILVSRGGEPHSALIAIGSDYPGNFSHVAVVYVDPDTRLASVVESNAHSGVNVSTVGQYLRDVKLRVMVLRLRADLSPLVADPWIPHRAAARALTLAQQGGIPYDFAINHRDRGKMYCSEVVATAYEPFGIHLWQVISRISAPGSRSWLAALGVRNFEPRAPSTLEYDPQLRVVAEWRDPETLYDDHIDNVVTEAMLEGAGRGDRLGYPPAILPFVRLAKLYSVIAHALGGDGPIPPGLSASTALRIRDFNRRHRKIKEQVIAAAQEFHHREGYVPPEWELLSFAKRARDGGP